jgi:hypothetical protein
MACQTTIILSGEETKLTCICVVAKKQIFKIGYYKKQSFATGKNVVHDEKDLAQVRSLSLSGHTNKLWPERNAAVDSENVTSSGSYNLVHGLSSNNHSF